MGLYNRDVPGPFSTSPLTETVLPSLQAGKDITEWLWAQGNYQHMLDTKKTDRKGQREEERKLRFAE